MLNGEQAKECSACHRVLPLSEFYTKGFTADGNVRYRGQCIHCHIAKTTRDKHKSLKKDPILYRKKLLITNARSRAQKAGLDFSISLEWLDQQNLEHCPISKQPFRWRADYAASHEGPDPLAPSIDRIDSSKGYTPDNSWVISHRMNAMKNDSTYRELFVLANAIAKEMMNRICLDLPS